jgi:hypothetical protein
VHEPKRRPHEIGIIITKIQEKIIKMISYINGCLFNDEEIEKSIYIIMLISFKRT